MSPIPHVALVETEISGAVYFYLSCRLPNLLHPHALPACRGPRCWEGADLALESHFKSRQNRTCYRCPRFDSHPLIAAAVTADRGQDLRSQEQEQEQVCPGIYEYGQAPLPPLQLAPLLLR